MKARLQNSAYRIGYLMLNGKICSGPITYQDYLAIANCFEWGIKEFQKLRVQRLPL